MVRHRGRPVLGAISGLGWGLGAAVIVQQLGLWPLDPLLGYGLPVAAAVISAGWGRRGRAVASVSMLIVVGLVPGSLLAQGSCAVSIENGEWGELAGSTVRDPLVVPGDFESVFVEVSGAGEGEAEFWVEIGGFRIPVASGSVDGGFDETITREDFGPFSAPGLYHVGGSIAGGCSGDGYVKIEGSPIDNPIGLGAIGAVGLGLLGTWLAGRPRSERSLEQHERRQRDSQDAEDRVARPARAVAYRPPRLTARLYDAESGRPLRRFVRGRRHRIDVTMDAGDDSWTSLDLPRPRSEASRVVLTAPDLMADPIVGELASSPSGVVSLELTVPANATTVDARMIAIESGRIAHTVRLPAEPDTDPSTAGDGTSPNVATAETTVSAGRFHANARVFDGAVLVNHSGGTPRITAIAGDDAAVVEVGEGDVAEAVSKIRSRLGEVVEQPEDFDALADPGTVELLVFLAHHGRLLRNALVGDFLNERLAGAAALQVASATPDAYFPFEFAYDFPAPAENASLCPAALDALRDDDPTAPCPGEHTEDVVCPLGFWGFTRIIERHAYQPGETLPAGFLLRSTPRKERAAMPPGSVVFAASDRVDAVAAGSVDRLAGELSAVAGDAVEARKWDEWIDDVAAGPALTVLLPHTVYSDTLDTYGLEIGTSDRRWAGDIDARFVPPEERPVVTLLLGCETAAAGKVSYERFPGLFRRAGSEVVFGTLTEILGRHAAPVGGALAAEIGRAWEDRPMRFGEVMLRLRRTLLADGIVAVLAVVAFGDADWTVGSVTPASPQVG